MSKRRKKQLRPYLMRGVPRVTEPRATVLDPPDDRVRTIPQTPLLKPEEIRLRCREMAIDPRLRVINHCFQRWAATPTDGEEGPRLARPQLIFTHGSQHMSAPLDEHQAKHVDRIMRYSPPWATSFVRLWYRSGLSVKDIAAALAIRNRQSVYQERILVLGYFLGRFIAEGVEVQSWDEA